MHLCESGEGGIRTHDGFTRTRVPGERTSPLCDLSNSGKIVSERSSLGYAGFFPETANNERVLMVVRYDNAGKHHGQ